MPEGDHSTKRILVVRPSSIVDAITNSSSEAFVVAGDRTLEEVRGIVRDIFETAFDYYTARKDKGLLGEYGWYPFSRPEAPHGLYEVRRVDDTLDWFGHDVWKPGDIVVESTYDNSIPSELFDDLEGLLNATRYHLG